MGNKSRSNFRIPHCVRKAYCVGKCKMCIRFSQFTGSWSNVGVSKELTVESFNSLRKAMRERMNGKVGG